MTNEPREPYVAFAEPNSEAPYVIDRNMVIWAVVRDGGMLTRADHAGITSCGITWGANHLGPLIPLDPRFLFGQKPSDSAGDDRG